MTRDEFIEWWAAGSGLTVEAALDRRKFVPCRCGDATCEGWASLPLDFDPFDVGLATSVWPDEE